jgi:hypothetical protein
MPPQAVHADSNLSLIGEHDDHGISFKLEECNVSTPGSTGNQWMDSLWKIKYEDVKALSVALFHTARSDPLEFRGIALSALKLAARPQDFGVDADFASKLCLQTMHV